MADKTKPKKPKRVIVTRTELATMLGVPEQDIPRLVRQGIVVQAGTKTTYDLKATVPKYIQALRSLSRDDRTVADLTRELKFWQVEERKQKVRDWRLEHDREVVQRVIRTQRHLFGELSKALEDVPSIQTVLSSIRDSIDRTPVDSLILQDDDTMDEEGLEEEQEDGDIDA